MQGWLQGLRCIFVPINLLIIGTHSYVFKTWHIALLVMLLLTGIAAYKRKWAGIKTIGFLGIWFCLCLMPVCKIFPVDMSCGYGSRLAYLATAPICLLLTYGIAMFSTGSRISFLCRSAAVIVIGLAAIILNANNLAWAEAGQLTNKIVREFKNYYRNTAGDPLTYISGLPMLSEKGINASVGLYGGMDSVPTMDRTIHNCKDLDSNDQFTSFGFIKEAITDNRKRINLLYWDYEAKVLKPVTVVPADHNHKLWQGNSLKRFFHCRQFILFLYPKAVG